MRLELASTYTPQEPPRLCCLQRTALVRCLFESSAPGNVGSDLGEPVQPQWRHVETRHNCSLQVRQPRPIKHALEVPPLQLSAPVSSLNKSPAPASLDLVSLSSETFLDVDIPCMRQGARGLSLELYRGDKQLDVPGLRRQGT